MSKFKMLYRMMHDDLKDADMIIDYACELKETDKKLGDYFATNAKERLAHFDSIHKIFQEEVENEIKNKDGKGVYDCLWDETHRQMQEWYDCIEKAVEKY